MWDFLLRWFGIRKRPDTGGRPDETHKEDSSADGDVPKFNVISCEILSFEEVDDGKETAYAESREENPAGGT